jgi:hypothetical protein
MPAKSTKPKSVTFRTAIRQSGNNTGVVVPAEVIVELGAGKRAPVLVSLNGYEYRTTVGAMGGQSMVSVSAAVRAGSGLKGGDAVRVTLTVAETPRTVEIPPDLEAAFTANGSARAFFSTLSNSLQRFHIDNINGAKTAETRQRRIDTAVAKFLEGRQR